VQAEVKLPHMAQDTYFMIYIRKENNFSLGIIRARSLRVYVSLAMSVMFVV